MPIDFNKPSGHGVYFSGNFEIERKVANDLGRKAGYRVYVVSINCGGADRDDETQYEIRAVGYSSPANALEENKVYFLRGLFFPTNTVETKMDHFYFEGSDHALVGPADEFKGVVMDAVGVSGVGIVAKIQTIVEQCCENLRDKDDVEIPKTTVVTVKHTDYHPSVKPAPTFFVEYRVRPYKYLSGIPRILKLGREAVFHGYLKDFNEESRCYVVIVNRVSTTCGHRDASEFDESTIKKEESAEGSGRSKPKKFIPKSVTAPFKSPIIPPASAPSVPSGPAEYPAAPMSASASELDEPLSKAPATKKRAVASASKKRPKARAARRTSSSTTLDLTATE